MRINEVSISDSFKTQVARTKFSILLFVIVYILLFILAIAIAGLSVYGGIKLIMLLPKLITILIGLGVASFGLLIFIFIIKFIFKSHKIDYSHLIQIYRKDEPELFKILDELTYKIDTEFPKKVYLSADVNASVFYDSSFWSMFFPIKKNLQIGLGLVNTVSKEELKAILSHEFGHFSQKSMKAGSFVYNVNQVIFNMLYDNESFDNLIVKLANINGYIGLFVVLAVKIIHGIQWVLAKVYEVINKNYLALSREMEFHADEIAANVTGYEPLKTSLLRMQLADHSFNTVLSFYDEKFENKLVSDNIYDEQLYVMNFIAKKNDIKIEKGFPSVLINDLNRYNKSKLIIENQWASHPSTEDRIKQLEKTNLVIDQTEMEPANNIFSNIEATQKNITQKLFKAIDTKEPKILLLDDFKKTFNLDYLNNTFSDIYNGYYNDKNPLKIEVSKNIDSNKELNIHNLFSDDKLDLVYTSIALENDIETLNLIIKKEIQLKTFDYDGVRYKREDSKRIQKKLTTQLAQINKKIKENDLNIFIFFKQKENTKSEKKLVDLYNKFIEYDNTYENKVKIYSELLNNLNFIQFTTEIDDIKRNFKNNKALEKKLKTNIKEFLNADLEISENMQEDFKLYLSREWNYFESQKYLDKNLELLFKVLDFYLKVLMP